MNSPATARLHILFAKEAPIGIIFRKGPSKQVRLILWHTDTDTFEAGQWLKGQIYEDSAALSPNGKLLAYFAADYRPHRPGPLFSSTWITISRPPYLTALALWFTYWRGAAFPDNQTFLLSGADKLAEGYTLPSPLRVREIPSHWDYLRERGWQCTSGQGVAETPQFGIPGPYQKPLADSTVYLELRHLGNWKKTYWLRHRDSGASVLLKVDQAEIDPTGRLILAYDGKLFAAKVNPDLTHRDTELADFNGMVFEPIAPPDWAKQWPFY